EIGCGEDAKALEEAMRAGIAVIASAHGSNKEELMGRPVLKNLIESQAFERIIILSRRLGPGTVEEIFDGSWQLIS
ncbi:MAG: stage iii sporulation protein aa, partial [Clostridiales bacterium]